MKALKITGIILGSIVILFLIVSGIYLLVNIQGEAESFETGNPEMKYKILIASQGSEFKNKLVNHLTEKLMKDSIYSRVIDVSGLPSIKEDEWNVLVLIHTTEQYRLQVDVKEYLDRATNLNKVILITTSGDGKWKTQDYDVDIFTSASRMEELNSLVSNIITRINIILEKTEIL